MKHLKRASSRGQAAFPGVASQHTFSFGSYHDPANVRVSVLRVLNDDTVSPRAGFPTHGHRDMEIISYVLAGELAHRDSLGNTGSVRAGEVQVMSAGTGITHSEFNASDSEPLRFLQIWIEPDAAGHAPAWQQIRIDEASVENSSKSNDAAAATAGSRARLIVGPDGSDAPMTVHQDMHLHVAQLNADASCASIDLAADRIGYVHVTRGAISIDGSRLEAGDALALQPASGRIELLAEPFDGTDSQAEALIFDLPQGPVVLH